MTTFGDVLHSVCTLTFDLTNHDHKATCYLALLRSDLPVVDSWEDSQATP